MVVPQFGRSWEFVSQTKKPAGGCQFLSCWDLWEVAACSQLPPCTKPHWPACSWRGQDSGMHSSVKSTLCKFYSRLRQALQVKTIFASFNIYNCLLTGIKKLREVKAQRKIFQLFLDAAAALRGLESLSTLSKISFPLVLNASNTFCPLGAVLCLCNIQRGNSGGYPQSCRDILVAILPAQHTARNWIVLTLQLSWHFICELNGKNSRYKFQHSI